MTKRKLTDDDRTILARVFQDHGSDWTYKALAVTFRVGPFTDLKRWTKKRLAAFMFLGGIAQDYTFKAIYKAAEVITEGSHA